MNNVVLAVSDEISFVDALGGILEEQGKEVLRFDSITRSMHSFADKHCSMIVIGVDELDLKTIKLLDNLHRVGSAPIFVCYKRASEEQRILALNRGATVCVNRECSLREYSVMIDALIRVYHAVPGKERGEVLSFKNGLVIDMLNWSVWLNGTPIKLTRREFLALLFLAQNKNRVLTRKEIYSVAWQSQNDYEIDGSVKSLIKSLRKKIGDSGHRIIQNIRGVGYRLMDEESTKS